MKSLKRSTVIVMSTVLCVTVLVVLSNKARAIHHRQKFESVAIIGHHHMGSNFSVSDFYINGYAGSNVGREGGGGGTVCCALLPKKWRPGLVAEVRWQVGDWTLEHVIPKKMGAVNNAQWKNYKAIVPIERYETPEELYVHFFSNGRVRVVSSLSGVHHSEHPVIHGDPSSATSATKGIVIAEMFSKAELDARYAQSAKRGMW